ncbi:hypothetical protein VQW74_04385, partial [Helicobacter pylori]
MSKLEKILLEITQLDPSKECLKFLANRIKSSDYRGLHLSQHNRYDQNKIKTIIQAIFNEVGEDFLPKTNALKPLAFSYGDTR